MKKILIITITLFFLSCKNDSFENEAPMNSEFLEKYDDTSKIFTLCNKILNEGDTIAFQELRVIYSSSEQQKDFLYFSTFMAEKYNYMPAYQFNYSIMKNSNNRILKKMALFNLLKSYEMGNKWDVGILNENFPSGIPTSSQYLEEIAK